MAEPFILEKDLWTETDFDNMGWHDNTIHAFSFSKKNELLFDIDYIFKWVHPKPGKRYFRFWISPCTIIFENVYSVIFDMEISAIHHRKIDNVSKSDPVRSINAEFFGREFEYDWIIETLNGEISFKSTGYKLHVRQKPALLSTDEMDLAVRGGISFSTNIGNS